MNDWITRTPDRPSRQKAIWPAALVGLTMAFGVVAAWQVISDRAHEHVDAAIDFTARINESLIVHDIDHRLAALDRLARRTRISGEEQQRAWEADATRYIRDMPGFEAIIWADSSLQARWAVSLGEHETAASRNLAQWDSFASAIATARESGGIALSQPFESASGDLRVAVFLPILEGEQVDGVIVAVLRLEAWLSAVISDAQDADHHARILLEGREVFRHLGDAGSIDESQTHRYEFETHGLTWTTLITPTTRFLSAGHGDSSTLVLIVGLLFSALAAVVVYLALVARARSRQFQDMATRLATLFRNLPGMAYRGRGSPGWPMEFVSEGCRALSGYSRRDFGEGRVAWAELIHPDDQEATTRDVLKATQAGQAYELEYRITNRKGEVRWMWERGRAGDSDGNGDSYIEGFISDVTDHKRAEQALIEARAFSEAVLDTAADAVITIDSHSKIEKLNRAAQQMFGYSFEEAHGKDVNLLMPEEYRSDHGQFVANYFETDESRVTGSGRELIAQRKDGSVFPIYLSISEVRDRSKRKFVGLVRDISEQRAAENEARQHRENLAHVDRLNMLGEMATGIAHEINQPLTAISLFVQAGGRLLSAKKLDRLPEIFDKLNQHAHRASAVIERMQSMARRRDSVKEVIDCSVLVDDVAKLAEAEARIRDMTIEVDTPSGLPTVSVDAVQIQQVALNLLRNGMEAMRSVDCRDGNVIGLRTRLDGDGNIEVSVIDKGSGVPEEVAAILFAPFSTTKKSGMGMGLSISRAIIIAHGGRLDFRNNETCGATFFFTLPTADQEGQNE
jgi:two-component system, LuxR family, sensor kinase FixL